MWKIRVIWFRIDAGIWVYCERYGDVEFTDRFEMDGDDGGGVRGHGGGLSDYCDRADAAVADAHVDPQIRRAAGGAERRRVTFE